jgi:hypothetical protein
MAQLEMSAQLQRAESTCLGTNVHASSNEPQQQDFDTPACDGSVTKKRRENPYEVFYTSLRRQRGEHVAPAVDALIDDLLESEMAGMSDADAKREGGASNTARTNHNSAPFSNIKLAPMSLRRNRRYSQQA